MFPTTRLRCCAMFRSSVPENKIVSILGGNGAGKTTTLRAISGLVALASGEIFFEGKRSDHLEADKIVARGIAHVPEGRRVFPDMTVAENLRIGAFLRNDRQAVESDLQSICERLPRLRERLGQQAKTLSGGEQQMLAIGRALMAKPRLLLLDEPSMGLAPIVIENIVDILKSIDVLGVLLVEQNASMALDLADYAYVLENGRIVLQGEASSLKHEPRVKKAYLGG